MLTELFWRCLQKLNINKFGFILDSKAFSLHYYSDQPKSRLKTKKNFGRLLLFLYFFCFTLTEYSTEWHLNGSDRKKKTWQNFVLVLLVFILPQIHLIQTKMFHKNLDASFTRQKLSDFQFILPAGGLTFFSLLSADKRKGCYRCDSHLGRLLMSTKMMGQWNGTFLKSFIIEGTTEKIYTFLSQV